MMKRMHIWGWLCSLLMIAGSSCVKPFEPPAIINPNSYLVVEGIVVPGSDSSSITLSRSRNLADTTTFLPENGASVRIVSRMGQTFQLQAKGNGRYAGVLNLPTGQEYQLKDIHRYWFAI